jgi:glycosyltransferase involved in cell wall biosynthesis
MCATRGRGRGGGRMNIRAYILAKNEAANIRRCLDSLSALSIPAVVLDSGSTDQTVAIARACGATVETYRYTTHLNALEHICTARIEPEEFVMVLDADMRVSSELLKEGVALLQKSQADVVQAPVAMYWDGLPLRFGSLYPPKPFLFRRGKHYFQALGHGEALRPDVKPEQTRARLVHDDRKGLDAFIESQLRYSRNLAARAREGDIAFRDKLRMKTPFMIFIVPLVSYLFRGGLFSGRGGLAYAIDRMIVEAIMHRRLSLQGEDTKRTEAAASLPHG